MYISNIELNKTTAMIECDFDECRQRCRYRMKDLKAGICKACGEPLTDTDVESASGNLTASAVAKRLILS